MLPVLSPNEPHISPSFVKTLDHTAVTYFADTEFYGLVCGRREAGSGCNSTCLQSFGHNGSSKGAEMGPSAEAGPASARSVLGSGSQVNKLPASVFSQSPQSPCLRSPSLRGWPSTTATRTPCLSQASLQRGCRPGGSCMPPVLCASPSWPGRWLVSWGTPVQSHIPYFLGHSPPRTPGFLGREARKRKTGRV